MAAIVTPTPMPAFAPWERPLGEAGAVPFPGESSADEVVVGPSWVGVEVEPWAGFSRLLDTGVVVGSRTSFQLSLITFAWTATTSGPVAEVIVPGLPSTHVQTASLPDSQTRVSMYSFSSQRSVASFTWTTIEPPRSCSEHRSVACESIVQAP